MVTFWAQVKTINFKIKLVWIFWGYFLEKFGLLFLSTSGHTVSNCDQQGFDLEITLCCFDGLLMNEFLKYLSVLHIISYLLLSLLIGFEKSW